MVVTGSTRIGIFGDRLYCENCGSSDITTKKESKRVGDLEYESKLINFGYYNNVHQCNNCPNKWVGDRE